MSVRRSPYPLSHLWLSVQATLNNCDTFLCSTRHLLLMCHIHDIQQSGIPCGWELTSTFTHVQYCDHDYLPSCALGSILCLVYLHESFISTILCFRTLSLSALALPVTAQSCSIETINYPLLCIIYFLLYVHHVIGSSLHHVITGQLQCHVLLHVALLQAFICT